MPQPRTLKLIGTDFPSVFYTEQVQKALKSLLDEDTEVFRKAGTRWLDDHLAFPLALFEVISAFTLDPDSDLNRANFGLAWRIEPQVTARLLAEITKYQLEPMAKWSKRRLLLQSGLEDPYNRSAWDEIARNAETAARMIGGAKVDLMPKQLRQVLQKINDHRGKILAFWQPSIKAYDRVKRGDKPERWFLSKV